jgi:hypothetical protein
LTILLQRWQGMKQSEALMKFLAISAGIVLVGLHAAGGLAAVADNEDSGRRNTREAYLGSAFAIAARQFSANEAAVSGNEAIVEKIRHMLATEHLSSATHLDVGADGYGVVWFTGIAQSQDDVDAAVSIARSTEGVTGVHTDVKIVAQRPTSGSNL